MKITKLLNNKEKRILLIVIFIVAVFFTIMALISGLINVLQLVFDLSHVRLNNFGAVYHISYINTIKPYFIISIILDVLLFVLSFFLKPKVNFILLIVNIALVIIFSIILRLSLPRFNDYYPHDFELYNYELFSSYVSSAISILIPLFIAELANWKLTKIEFIKE